MSEKTEQPTDKKLEDARDKGQVPVSRDLARLTSLLVVGELTFATQSLWMEAMQSLLKLSFMRIGQPFVAALGELLTSATILLLLVFAVCWVVCSISGVLAHWGQFGILIAPEALEPKFDKLNPINGFKGIFSKKKLTELLLTVFKASLIGWIVYSNVREQLPFIISLSGGEPKDVMYGFIELVRSVFHVIIGLCLCLGLMDFAVQKAFHIKELMMDKEEIKREYKESEGDPMIKSKRKQLARQMIMGDAPKKTEKANAVVTNPTHFAVAMFYDGDEAPVPVVLAKGKDAVAHAMIRVARENKIPVIRHVWLARTLYATARPDVAVPKSSYEAVAHVYAVVADLVASKETDREVELESRGEPPSSYR